jgi:hypothetical protein
LILHWQVQQLAAMPTAKTKVARLPFVWCMSHLTPSFYNTFCRSLDWSQHSAHELF